jgi:hypothetical protein
LRHKGILKAAVSIAERRSPMASIHLSPSLDRN